MLNRKAKVGGFRAQGISVSVVKKKCGRTVLAATLSDDAEMRRFSQVDGNPFIAANHRRTQRF